MSRKNNFKKLFMASLAASVVLPVSAQANSGKEIEEVVVTATRRAESIQDVPISISAYGADFIENSGVKDLRDIALFSPNLTISNSAQLTNSRIAIRGVGSVGNAGIEPSVGVFIDGVYYPRPGSVIGNLLDIEAVEVLRGPQGTLFGRNTPVGALNIRTKDPSLDGFDASVELGLGSQNSVATGAMLNFALSDSSALRISGKYTDRDGYGTNLLNGENFGARKDTNLRVKYLYQPSDTFKLKLTADYGDIDSGGSTIEFLNSAQSPRFLGTLGALAGPNGPRLLTSDPFDHNVFQDQRDDLQDQQYGVSLDITYDLESGHSIRSITSVRNWEAESFESAIRLPIQLFPRKTQYDNETFAQEVQILSPEGEKFDYVAGLFYYQEDYDISQDFDLGAQFCIPVVAGLAGVPAALGCANGQQIDASDSDFSQDLSSAAIFGQGSWHFNNAVSMTLGGRYTNDDKEADFSNVVNNFFVTALSIRESETHLGLNINEQKFDTDQFTYFANLSYDINDDVMLFATTSTGYKSGGFNTDGTFPALTRRQRVFGPEDTTNYEIGLKNTLLDGSMLFNLTAFRMNIEGFQDRAFDGISFITRNVGKLRQQGVEADITWGVSDNFKLIGGFSYLDSEFIDYRNASPLPGGAPQNLTGASAHFSPDWQYSLVGDWVNDVQWFGGSTYFLRAEVQYTGEQNVGGNTNQNPQSNQSAYTLFNASVGLRSQDHKWDVSLRAKNLSDEGYCLTIFDQPFGAQLGGLNRANNTIPQRCVVGTPRTYGIEMKYRF
jgi:iron complex outermembrane receptor protein